MTSKRDEKGISVDVPEITAKGVATLNGISAVSVSCPSLTANSLIFITIRVPSGTVGLVWVGSMTPGTGFTIVSVALATSQVSWMVTEP